MLGVLFSGRRWCRLEHLGKSFYCSAGPPKSNQAAWFTRFVNAFGAFSDYYNEQYLTNYSATLISMIGAVQVFILYLCECLRRLLTLIFYTRQSQELQVLYLILSDHGILSPPVA